MKNIKATLIIVLFSYCCNTISAQVFLKRTGKKPSFTEMQLQFDEWKNKTDIKKAHHWKYYKRWENEMLMHTDAKGEPVNPAIYIDAVVKSANEKRAHQSEKMLATNWSPVGPYTLPGNETGYMQNGIARINCIAFDPTNSNTYYVGVGQGGVWKTTNNGVSWTPLTDNLPIERISDIAIDPNNVITMYISVCDFEYIDWNLYEGGAKRNTNSGLGVYKTTDGGVTWQPTGLSFQLSQGDASLIRKVLVNPANSNNLIACGVSGMYTSSDGGNNWAKTMDSLFWDLVQDPVSPNILYAASGWLAYSNIGTAGIYKSIDFGNTWTMLNTGITGHGVVQRIKIAIAESNPNYIYAMAIDNQSGSYGIYKSTNAGSTWQFINPGVNLMDSGTGNNPGGQGTYDLGFTVKPTDENTVYVGGVNIWASTDGAQTFNPVAYWQTNYGPTIHGDIHFIETQPSTGKIFVCSDGGLYQTSTVTSETWNAANGGSPWPTQWTTISNGMNITSFYRISSSRNTLGRLAAGAQDNATFYYDGTAWNTIDGGDGMDNYLDPLNNNNVICSSEYGSFAVSTNGGTSFSPNNMNPGGEAAEWTTPIVADYNIPGTLYAGFTNVEKSTNNGSSWTSLSTLPNDPIHNNEISALAVSYTNSNVLYAARRVRYEYNAPSTVYITTNGGGSWANVTAGLPDSLYPASIDISQTDANTAYVVYAQFSAGNKVFKTSNGGSTWQNISYNLPNIPVNCVKTVPGSGELMIATDIGLYVLDSANSTWVNNSSGLPNVILSDIEFNTTLNKIYLATFGRGIWENDLSALITSVKSNSVQDLGIELYPSPNDGEFTIKVMNTKIQNEIFNLDIVDITGRLVFSAALSGNTYYHEKINLVSGMYFAKIKSKSINGVKSFVVK